MSYIIMTLRLIFLTFVFTLNFVSAQQFQLSNTAEISVLTIGQGTSLYDAFGHSAFRVKDHNLDVVYGYGEYDFDEPNFYLKFAQGKLNYKMSKHRFTNVLNYYSKVNRTVKAQVLNLSTAEKQNLYNYLKQNYKPENRYYLYDYLEDNCATKIPEVLNKVIDIQFFNKTSIQTTYRTLIQDNLYWNSWGSVGINIALGAVIDREVTAKQMQFLPEYVHLQLSNATINKQPLVKSEAVLFQKKEILKQTNFWISPLFVFLIIALAILFITYNDYKNKKRSRWLDVVLFALTGVIGIGILLLWFATDHTATANNYNVLWAFPLNVLLFFQLRKVQVKPWVKRYLIFLIIMLCLLVLHWLSGVQVFAKALIPLLIALFVRYLFLVWYFNNTTKTH